MAHSKPAETDVEPLTKIENIILNKYTNLFDVAQRLNEPVDWIFKVKENEYDVLYNIFHSNYKSLYERKWSDTLYYTYVSLLENNMEVNKDIFIYDFIRIFYDIYLSVFGMEGCDERIIDYVSEFEVVSKLSSTFTNSYPIDKFIDEMNTKYNRSLEHTYEVINKIKAYKNKSEQLKDLYNETIRNTDYQVTSKTIEMHFRVRKTKEAINPALGTTIFNDMKISDRVTYAHYISDTQIHYYKIFKGTELDKEPEYERTMIQKRRGSKINSIQFTMWLGSGSIYNTTYESFYYGRMDLTTGIVTFKVRVLKENFPTEYENIAKEKIRSAFPKLEDYKIRTKFYVAELNIFKAKSYLFREHALLHQVMLDPMVNETFYMDEATKPFAFKKRLEFRYIPYLSKRFIGSGDDTSIAVKWSMRFKELDNLSEKPKKYYVDDDRYIRIRISNATSRDNIEEIVENIMMLLKYHFTEPNTKIINKYYTRLFGESELESMEKWKRKDTEDIKDNEARSSNVQGKLRLEDLINKHSKVFGRLYGRDCGGNRSPITFNSESEANIWKDKESKEGRKVKTPVQFPAPPETPIFWFACPDPVYPHPDIVDNRNPATMNNYSYVPCCSNFNPHTREGSDFNKVYGKVIDLERESKIAKVSDKFLHDNNRGVLPVSIKNSIGKDYDMYKIGASREGPNSFLSCVLKAVEDPDYNRESYVENIRIKISEKINASLLKQELYDIDEKEIKRRLGNIESFYDPYLFYRAIEEIYNVNIFVFTNKNTVGNEDARLEIPRCRYLHARPKRIDRPTIIIFKNKGPLSMQKRLKYEHCELIVTDKEKYFQSDVAEKCYFVLEKIAGYITWIPEFKSIKSYNNIYNIDYRLLLKNSVVSQRIDSYGHARCFNFKWEGKTVSMFIPPSQPLNVGAENEIIYRISMNDAIKLIPRSLYSITKDDRGYIDGAWFSYKGVNEFFYIPLLVIREEDVGVEREGKSPILQTKEISAISRIEKLKKTLDIITQLVTWTFNVYRKGEGEDKDEMDTEFIDTFYSHTSEKYTGDTAEYYVLYRLREILPTFDNPIDCIKYIGEYTNLTRNGKFVFVDDNFLGKMKYFIKNYFYRNFGTEVMIEKKIQRYFASYTDFKQSPGVEVFIGRGDFNVWLDSRRNNIGYKYNIHTKINLPMHTIKHPFLLKHYNGDIFLIQNVQGVSHDPTNKIAKQVASLWDKEKINTGYYTVEDINARSINTLVYGISQGERLIPIIEPKEKNASYSEVIEFAGYDNYIDGIDKDARTAALLRLI